MDADTMEFITAIADKVSVIGILLYAWLKEMQRADRLEAKLILNKDIEAAKEA